MAIDPTKTIGELLKDAPAWAKVSVAFVLLALLVAIVWHQIAPQRADFNTAYHEEIRALNPSLDGWQISTHLEDLFNIAQTDDQRCRVGELYLDIAKGRPDANMPGGLDDFIARGLQRKLPCVKHLEERATTIIASAPRPTSPPTATVTPSPHRTASPLPHATAAPTPAVVAELISAAAQVLAAGTSNGAEGWIYLGQRAPRDSRLSGVQTITTSTVPQRGDTVTVAANLNLRRTADPRRNTGAVVGVITKGSSVLVVGTPLDVPSAENPSRFLVWAPVKLSRKEDVAVRTAPPTSMASARPGSTPTPSNLARDPNHVTGVDVSDFQGLAIDWAGVAGTGTQFAFIRATQGTGGQDSAFGTNWANAKAVGLLRGAYHMFSVGGDADAQARNYLTVVKLQPGDLPPVVDLELLGDLTTTSSATAVKVERFLKLVQDATGVKPVIYAGYAQLSAASGTSPLSTYPLWLPSYGVAAPTTPSGWDRWTFWQYSDRGKVSGIAGDVDLDRFNGTVEQLRKFALPKRP